MSQKKKKRLSLKGWGEGGDRSELRFLDFHDLKQVSKKKMSSKEVLGTTPYTALGCNTNGLQYSFYLFVFFFLSCSR